jgi:large conductance mechanosensitive channel
MNDFKQFLLRGNLVTMAVGIVIGLAFTAVVTALVGDLVTPLIAAIGGDPDFSKLTFTVNKSHFLYGAFIDALLSFVLIALVVFYFVVKPVNGLVARTRRDGSNDPTTRSCPECLSEIPLAARRCAFCTVEVAPAA